MSNRTWKQASFWPLFNSDLDGPAPNLPVGVGRGTEMKEIDSPSGTSHTLLAPSAADKALRITELSMMPGADATIVLSIQSGADIGKWPCAENSGPGFGWHMDPLVLPAGKSLLLTTSVSTTVFGHVRYFEVEVAS